LAWALKISLKHKLFIWMALNNNILIKDNLCNRRWTKETSCVFCLAIEIVDHLFFNCPFIAEFWCKIFTDNPQIRSLSINFLLDFWNSCLLSSNFHYWRILLTASMWVLWLERNKRVFNSSSTSRVANIYFLIFHLLICWTSIF
jgi:zinc-binding in reverse transcriptase